MAWQNKSVPVLAILVAGLLFMYVKGDLLMQLLAMCKRPGRFAVNARRLNVARACPYREASC